MEIYEIKNDVSILCVQVKTFPKGIAETFDALVSMLPDGFTRPFYGIGYMDKDGSPVYKAGALEKYDGEARNYNCEHYTLEKGQYLGVSLHEWRAKTDSIKDIFEELSKDSRIDRTKPCVEWYKNEHEMVCMIKMDAASALKGMPASNRLENA